MCVEGTDMEVETKYPAGRLGRADRWLESPLGGWLGQKQAVLLRDGGAGEELDSNTTCGVPKRQRRSCVRSGDGVVTHYRG